MAVSTPELTGEHETNYLSSENARLKNIISQCPECSSGLEKMPITYGYKLCLTHMTPREARTASDKLDHPVRHVVKVLLPKLRDPPSQFP